MATGGNFGVIVDGQEKIAYNHNDSYFEGLGEDLAEQLGEMLARPGGMEALKQQARELRIVNEEVTLSDEERERVKPYHNPGVSGGTSNYALLRRLQGDLRAALDDAKLLYGEGGAPNNEYAYIANLDTGRFEVYSAYYRWKKVGEVGDSRYPGMHLHAELPLDAMPASFEAFIAAQHEED